MADSNTVLRRFEAGAVVKITDGAGTPVELVLKALEPGSVRWKHGGYTPLEYTDRGITQTPYEGDEVPSEIELAGKFSGQNDAEDVIKHMAKRDTVTGLVHLFQVVVDMPTVKGGATGERYTWTGCWLDGWPEYQAGAQFDTWRIRLKSKLAQPTTATY